VAAPKNKKPGTTGYPGALGREVTRGMIKRNYDRVNLSFQAKFIIPSQKGILEIDRMIYHLCPILVVIRSHRRSTP